MPAWGYWTASGSASGSAQSGMLSPPINVTVPATAASDVAVSWTTGAGGVTPAGYFVTRHAGVTNSPACASSPASLIIGTACNDSAVPDGTFAYIVTAVYRTWTAASTPSGTVTVANAAAVHFVIEPTDTLAGTSVTPAIKVVLQTADDDPFPSAGVPVTLAIGTNPGAGILTGTTTVNTDANGVATFNDISVSEAGVGYTLTASSPGLTSDTSALFTVTAPFLGAAQTFSILSGTAVVNTGVTTVSGDVGVSPAGTVTGFPTGAVGGDLHVNDAAAAAAQSALLAAYNDLKGRSADDQIIVDLGGLTFQPGVYHSTAALGLTGTVILDGGGDLDATFVFQTDAAFNTAASSSVVLANGAQAANVYWVVTGAAGTGASTTLSGTIFAVGAITLGAGTTLIGRALSRGAVTLAGSTIRFTAALPPTITIDGGGTATTKDTTPTITGTSNAAALSPVTVRIAGQTLHTTIGGGGTWSVTAAELAAGTYQLVAKVRDAAGNGTAVSQLLTVEVNPAPVDLGTAESYGVLAVTAITNTGTTVLNGDLGISPGVTVAGFESPSAVNGTQHVNDSAAATAQSDLLTALNEVSARTPHTEIAGDLGGQTFHIGLHHQTAALALTGTVTLDAEGNPDAIFIFVTDAAFNTAASSSVVLANGAQAANVYWVVAGAAGTGASTTLSGTILARGAITLGASTVLSGRALSRDAVTLTGNTITTPGFTAFARQGLVMKSPACSDLSATTDETTPATTDEDTPAAPSADISAETLPGTPPVSSTLTTPPEGSVGLVESIEPQPAANQGQTTGDSPPSEVAAP